MAEDRLALQASKGRGHGSRDGAPAGAFDGGKRGSTATGLQCRRETDERFAHDSTGALVQWAEGPVATYQSLCKNEIRFHEKWASDPGSCAFTPQRESPDMSDNFDQRHAKTRRVLIMGVSGSGKSTIGEAVAERTGCGYIDGDKYHPPENIRKMSSGISLDDEDRQGWLEELARLFGRYREADESVMIGCSGLKQSYRDILRQGDSELVILFLNGDYELILQRMHEREHFFSPEMLKTQFATLEPPTQDEAIHIDISKSFDNVIDQCVQALEALE